MTVKKRLLTPPLSLHPQRRRGKRLVAPPLLCHPQRRRGCLSISGGYEIMRDSPEQFYVYIMADKKRGMMYVGFSSDLVGRVWKHKTNYYPNAYTSKHKLYKLVYYEIGGDAYETIKREKRLKRWNREWKFKLIEKDNPDWNDLYDDL